MDFKRFFSRQKYTITILYIVYKHKAYDDSSDYSNKALVYITNILEGVRIKNEVTGHNDRDTFIASHDYPTKDNCNKSIANSFPSEITSIAYFTKILHIIYAYSLNTLYKYQHKYIKWRKKINYELCNY